MLTSVSVCLVCYCTLKEREVGKGWLGNAAASVILCLCCCCGCTPPDGTASSGWTGVEK